MCSFFMCVLMMLISANRLLCHLVNCIVVVLIAIVPDCNIDNLEILQFIDYTKH